MDGVWKPKLHKALSFNGKNSYVVVPNSDSLSIKRSLTIIVRLNPLKCISRNNWGWILNKNIWSGTNYQVINDAKHDITFNVSNGSNYKGVRTFKSILPYTHIMITCRYNYDTGIADILYNTDIVASNNIGTFKLHTNDIYLVIGGLALNWYRGYMSQIRIYNRFLEDSEIKYAYRHPFDPISKEHLVLDLNPAGIDIANGKWWDLSGKGNHGTIYNATEVKLEEEVSVL